MTALTLRVIWKNPPVTLHEICKIFPKFQKHLLYMATFTLPQNLQEAAVTICSEKFGCPSQESLPKFKACVRYFLSNFHFNQMIALQKL